MKTLRCVMPGPGQVALESVELPGLESGRILVRTQFSLVSPGTELAMFNGTHVGLPNPLNLFAKYPFRPGYAAVGIVEASAHPDHEVGQPVFFYGFHQDAAVLDPETQLVLALPEGLALEQAPFAKLAQIAYTALAVTEDRLAPGPVAVIGLGLVGHFAARLFQRAGVEVYGFDTLEPRCRWAAEAGLANAVHVTGDLVETVRAATGGPVALAVEATGVGTLAISCLQMVADHGTVALLGSPRDKVEINTYELIHRTGARLVGAHERLVPLMAADGLDQRAVNRDMLNAIASGALGVTTLPTRVIAPADLADSYRALDTRKNEVLAVLLDWRAAAPAREGEGRP